MRASVTALSAMALAALAAAPAAADDVQMKDLPEAVQATLEKETKGAIVEDIERERRRDGTVVYEIEIERDNQEWSLIIDEKGKVLDRKRD